MINIKTPASRSSGPATSHMAEQGINRSGKRQTNMATVYTFLCGHQGYTAAEIARDIGIPGIDAVEARRRLYDMKGILAEQGEQRKCGVAKKLTVTWYAV